LGLLLSRYLLLLLLLLLLLKGGQEQGVDVHVTRKLLVRVGLLIGLLEGHLEIEWCCWHGTLSVRLGLLRLEGSEGRELLRESVCTLRVCGVRCLRVGVGLRLRLRLMRGLRLGLVV
jgi:hypothetical protein